MAAEAIDMATTATEDAVIKTGFADERIDWQFGGMPGWSRTDRDGKRWQYYGPLDRWGLRFLLRHFGLETRDNELTLEKVQFMAPTQLRALGNRAELKIVAAATGLSRVDDHDREGASRTRLLVLLQVLYQCYTGAWQ